MVRAELLRARQQQWVLDALQNMCPASDAVVIRDLQA